MSGGSVIRGLGGGSMFGRCGRLSGALAGVMERMRCCRWPCGWESGSGWKSIFCHRTVWCGSRSAVVGAGGGAAAGEGGVHWYWLPWSGCICECGLTGRHGRIWWYPGGFVEWRISKMARGRILVELD